MISVVKAYFRKRGREEKSFITKLIIKKTKLFFLFKMYSLIRS